MNKFKKFIYIFIILLIPFFVITISYNFYANNFNKISQNLTNIIEISNEESSDFSCTKNNVENITTISENYNLDYYEGDVVKKEISKNFNDPRIPQGYQFSEEDLQESYALVKNEKPIIVYLSFEDENKFAKINEFIGYGEIFVGYSKRADLENNEIFLGNSSENLSIFINQFLIQKCY